MQGVQWYSQNFANELRLDLIITIKTVYVCITFQILFVHIVNLIYVSTRSHTNSDFFRCKRALQYSFTF